MSQIVMDNKEKIVMRLVHYLITQENYTPIVVNGVKNEVWLENNEGPYKIVRINSNYIHNKEQYRFDIFKINNIAKQIKKKTLSLKVNVLNIFLDLNDDVKVSEVKNIDSISVKNDKELINNKLINNAFPSIKTGLIDDKDNVDLLINVTNDINEKTAKDNKVYESVFKPKKIIVTNVIITLCVLVYILQLFNSKLLYLGANISDFVKMGEVYRIITCTFIHAGIIHLSCNMYSLYIIGSQLETFIGKARFIFVYIISAISGSLMSLIFTAGASVGASGAIFGLLGSLLYFGYHYRIYLGSVLKNQIIPIIILNILLGFMLPGVDNAAHIGGLIGGYLATVSVGIKNKSNRNEMINGIIVLVIYIAFLVYMGIIK